MPPALTHPGRLIVPEESECIPVRLPSWRNGLRLSVLLTAAHPVVLFRATERTNPSCPQPITVSKRNSYSTILHGVLRYVHLC
jgi:hypothetical protein